MAQDVRINWFQIPATDLERATAFYADVLRAETMPMTMPGARMQAFVSGGRPVGAIVESEHVAPSDQGTLMFLDAGGPVGDALARVERAGGRIVLPRTEIGEYGVIGQFLDTEGNRLAFHGMS